MSRIRTIKPEAFTDEDLWDADITYPHLHLFRAFTGLWCQADQEGRFEWRPRQLKAAILPYWNGDFSHVLDAMVTCGFIQRYEHCGREFGVIPTFRNHQFINGKEPKSKIPAPEDSVVFTGASRVNDTSTTGKSRDDDAPIPSPSPSPSFPDPVPDPDPVPPPGGAGGDGGGNPQSPPAAPNDDPSRQIFRMHSAWRPSEDSIASVKVSGILDYAIPTFIGRFTGHFSATTETCADGDWNQRWLKWVSRDWNDPNKRPRPPERDAAEDDDEEGPVARRLRARRVPG